MTSRDFLPYGRQTIEEDDIEAVAKSLRGDFLTTGPTVAQFEAAFAEAAGARYAVACNSGTAALHLAAMGAGLGPGDAAIVPTLTFVATANAARYCDADVVFADVDPDTGLMSARHLEEALARVPEGLSAKVVIPVHLNGQLTDLRAIAGVASAASLTVIEDACHALGIPDVGASEHTAMACFSTHPVKAVATGEGGVVTTDDGELAQRLQRLRSHGLTRDESKFLSAGAFDGDAANPWYYELQELGWNYRLPDFACALGISQLAKLTRFVTRRRELASLYETLFSPLAPIVRPVPRNLGTDGLHLFVALFDFEAIGLSRRNVMARLKDYGVGSQVHYVPVHSQPYYEQRYGALDLPGARRYYERCLSLPLFPTMTDGDVRHVVDAVTDVVTRATRT